MSRYDKVDSAYKFLKGKEVSQDSFSLDELAKATGWETGTCKTYVSKRWFQYVHKDQKDFKVSGVAYLSKKEFRAIHSQKLTQLEDQSEQGKLIKKAKEFALLAVSTYNNPFTHFKTHGFIVDLVIAYTALFHAIFEKRGIEYFYKKKDGTPKLIDGQKKAWELTACIKEYWGSINTAEKANLELLIGLRNKIEHRSLPELDLMVAGYCQSSLSNFEEILINEFGDNHSLMANLAIAMQLTRTATAAQEDALKKFQAGNYKVVRDYIEQYNHALPDDIAKSQKYRLNVYLIPNIEKNKNKADLAVTFVKAEDLTADELAAYEQGIALIKGLESPYKYRPGQVVEQVKKVHPNFNMTRHTDAWKKHKARPARPKKEHKNEYCGYVSGFDGYLYSQKWVDLLIAEIK
ncbi:DUF3644 domain-containing protein [Idiomarina sp.]|uniref:DUF3644 domain-containing protein n=1 Tax=Idiomarina sp. TaxID=1874361 RepID=UPI002EC40B29|nr:DUF3644 domain-containing protein [Pseudomonadota bacterium]